MARWMLCGALVVLSAGCLSTEPEDSVERVARDFDGLVDIACWMSPCQLQGDFDGDERPDVALLVVRREGSVPGIAILHGNGDSVLFGAGSSFGNGGPDFSWMDHWDLLDAGAADEFSLAACQPNSNVLLVEKTGSASALIMADQGAYRWCQIGD